LAASASASAKADVDDAAMDRFNVERSPRYRLAMLSRMWTASSEKIYEREFGVSLSEWRIIAFVGAEQPINAAAITDRGMLEKSHISRLVAKLVERRIIISRADKLDGRKSWLTLSAKGRAIFEGIARLSLERDATFLDALSDQERAQLDTILTKLIAKAPCIR
jgi:DNA-binding MarR family transcriptional regulator